MPATIKIKNSSTASAVPTSSDLVQGELAVNVTDKRIFTENASGTVVELGTNPSILTLPDGSASAPTLTNDGDTNTGIFFPAADTVGISTGGTERLRVDSGGNLGLGVTPSAWIGAGFIDFIGNGFIGDSTSFSSNTFLLGHNAYYSSTGWRYKTTFGAGYYQIQGGAHYWNSAGSGTAGNAITFTQAMTLDASGNLGVGNTSPAQRLSVVSASANSTAARIGGILYGGNQRGLTIKTFQSAGGDDCGVEFNAAEGLSGYGSFIFKADTAERARIDSSGNLMVGTTTAGGAPGVTVQPSGALLPTTTVSTTNCVQFWNQATSGNNVFANFYTEGGGGSLRGSIIYSRGAGLVVYNTTSDYRAKTVNGPVENALIKVAALKPCVGRMNGADYDIDFFVAHELQEVVPSAVTGEKDAVKEDGTPDYQMVDKSALIPLLTAAIQEQQAIIETLTNRITALEQA